MKTEQQIQSPKIGRNSLWEEELSQKRLIDHIEVRVRSICSCKEGDLYFEKGQGYQPTEGCSMERACFIIRKDMREYGTGWPLDE